MNTTTFISCINNYGINTSSPIDRERMLDRRIQQNIVNNTFFLTELTMRPLNKVLSWARQGMFVAIATTDTLSLWNISQVVQLWSYTFEQNKTPGSECTYVTLLDQSRHVALAHYVGKRRWAIELFYEGTKTGTIPEPTRFPLYSSELKYMNGQVSEISQHRGKFLKFREWDQYGNPSLAFEFPKYNAPHDFAIPFATNEKYIITADFNRFVVKICIVNRLMRKTLAYRLEMSDFFALFMFKIIEERLIIGTMESFSAKIFQFDLTTHASVCIRLTDVPVLTTLTANKDTVFFVAFDDTKNQIFGVDLKSRQQSELIAVDGENASLALDNHFLHIFYTKENLSFRTALDLLDLKFERPINLVPYKIRGVNKASMSSGILINQDDDSNKLSIYDFLRSQGQPVDSELELDILFDK